MVKSGADHRKVNEASSALVNEVRHVIKGGTRLPQGISFSTSLAFRFDQVGGNHGQHGFVSAKV
jgi:hypothetical protein